MARRLAIPMIAITALASSTAAAQSYNNDRFELSIEIDPLSFVLGGYAAFVGATIPGVPNLVIDAGSYGFPVADFMMLPEQQEVGWKIDAYNALLGPEYYFSDDREGWSIALFILYSQIFAEHPTGKSTRGGSWVVLPSAAYTWIPFDSVGFYVGLWLGVAVILDGYEEIKVGDDTYEANRVGITGAGRIGWRF